MMQKEDLEETFEQSWAKYKSAIISYATASRSKSQDLKRALREDGKFLCGDKTYTTLLYVTFAHLDCESSTALWCLAHFLFTKSKKKAVESSADIPFLFMEVEVKRFESMYELLVISYVLILSVVWYTCSRGCGYF